MKGLKYWAGRIGQIPRVSSGACFTIQRAPKHTQERRNRYPKLTSLRVIDTFDMGYKRNIVGD
jgi:hypothetical protein